jgi:methionine-rich copper-binding protein CopC
VVLVASLLGLVATAALAHAHLQKTVPANGSVVNAAPASVILTFSEAAKLTACWLQKQNGSKEKVSGFSTTPAQQISVPLPPLEPGTYVLSWRVMGDDGHVLPGQTQFTVAASAQPTHGN